MPFEYHAPADHLERQILSSTSEESRTTTEEQVQPVGRCGATERRDSLEYHTH